MNLLFYCKESKKGRGKDGFVDFGDWKARSGRFFNKLKYRTTPFVYTHNKLVHTIENPPIATNCEHNFTTRHCYQFRGLQLSKPLDRKPG